MGKVDFSHNFDVYVFFLLFQLINVSILTILTFYMIINNETFEEIFLIIFSSLFYTLVTSLSSIYTLGIVARINKLNRNILKEFPRQNQFEFLRLVENIYDRANEAIFYANRDFGVLSMFSIGVVFLHSIFTFYFTLKVFVLNLELFSPKVVINLIWFLFLILNPTVLCVKNEILVREVDETKRTLRKFLNRESKRPQINSILKTKNCFLEKIQFSSSLFDYNLKLIFGVRMSNLLNHGRLVD